MQSIREILQSKMDENEESSSDAESGSISSSSE